MTPILNARIRTGSAYSQLDKDALCYLYLLSLYMRETATRSLRDTVTGTQKYKLGAELKNTTNRIKEFERHAKDGSRQKSRRRRRRAYLNKGSFKRAVRND